MKNEKKQNPGRQEHPCLKLIERTADPDFFRKLRINRDFSGVMEEYELSLEETALFMVILAKNFEHSSSVELLHIRQEYDLSQRDFLRYLQHAQALQKRNLVVFESDLRGRRNYINPEMQIDQGVFNYIVSGRDSLADLDFSDIYAVTEQAVSLIESHGQEKISERGFHNEFERLWSKLPADSLLKTIANAYPRVERMMLFQAMANHIEGQRGEGFSDFSQKIHRSLAGRGRFIRRLRENGLAIIRDKVLEIEEEGPFFHDPNFCLSAKTIDQLFPAPPQKKTGLRLDSPFLTRRRPQGPAPILHLPAETRIQLDDLDRVLQGGNFNTVMKRMKRSGFPAGLVALLHGGPGTGKTASALLLARHSRRELLQVDIAVIRDCWVGKSEKNMRQIFNDYRRACRTCRRTPILLFNEADALLGRRIEVAHSVDQMNNTLQNILLEELENFQGIFLATSNLVANLDPAFARRFLFKVEFQAPDREARLLIWRDKLPGLEKKLYLELAEQALTGAQIENIARLCLLQSAVSGKKAERKELLDLTANELNFGRKGENRAIGFA